MNTGSKNAEAGKLYLEKVQPRLIEAENYLLEITDFTKSTAQNSYSSADRIAGMTTILLVTVAILTLAMTIVLALYLSGSLTKPIKEIENAANHMAEGALNVQVRIIGDVEGSFRGSYIIGAGSSRGGGKQRQAGEKMADLLAGPAVLRRFNYQCGRGLFHNLNSKSKNRYPVSGQRFFTFSRSLLDGRLEIIKLCKKRAGAKRSEAGFPDRRTAGRPILSAGIAPKQC